MMASAPPVERHFRLGSIVVLRYSLRSALVATGMGAVAISMGLATLAWGPLGVGLADLVATAEGNPDTTTRFVLERLRGPRVLVAIGVGIALGLSGALFQTVTRNPLGSPDVIGLGAGAGAGVALATLFWPGAIPAPVGAVAGAAVAIGVVHFSTGLGFASPARVIITGIGVAAMSLAITQYVVAVALRDSASQLAAYLVGTLGTRNFQHVLIIVLALLVLVPLVMMLSHRLVPMDMGDQLADALGSHAVATRTWAIVLSVLLAASAVSVAGPIAFVALTAPHIARRMTRAPGPNLVVSAFTGAVIMLVSDLLVQQSPWFEGLPVGVITAGVGGVYLGYLLVTEWRKASA